MKDGGWRGRRAGRAATRACGHARAGSLHGGQVRSPATCVPAEVCELVRTYASMCDEDVRRQRCSGHGVWSEERYGVRMERRRVEINMHISSVENQSTPPCAVWATARSDAMEHGNASVPPSEQRAGSVYTAANDNARGACMAPLHHTTSR